MIWMYWWDRSGIPSPRNKGAKRFALEVRARLSVPGSAGSIWDPNSGWRVFSRYPKRKSRDQALENLKNGRHYTFRKGHDDE